MGTIKKLFLVMVCSFIITIFIAFNYLLWERENHLKSIENLNASKNASIDTLGEKIKSLNEKVVELENSNKVLIDLNSNITQDSQNISEILLQKNEIIYQLKETADLTPFEQKIRKWVEYINKDQYESAYNLQIKQTAGQDRAVDNSFALSPADFVSNYNNDLKHIRIKSIKPYIDEAANDKKGEIIFTVTLDVSKVENSNKSIFSQGENIKFFTITYDFTKGDWAISTISDYP